MDLDPASRDLIAKTILGEAGDQPPEGQAAVAHVIKNRLESKTGEFANGSVPEVVLGRNQFEAWSGDNRSRTAKVSQKSDSYKTAAGIADDVFSGKTPDPTNGATYFYSPKDQTALKRPAPSFAKLPSHGMIGDHAFFSKEGPQEDLVGEWTAPQNAGAGHGASPASAPADDLVSEWLPGAGVAPQAAPAVAGAHVMPVPAPPGPETLGQKVARMVGDAKGDTLTDTATRLGAGAVRGVGDIADTLAQGISYAGEKGAGALERTGVISPETAKSVSDWRSRINTEISGENAAFEAAKGNRWAPDIGRAAGQIAGTAPFLGAGGSVLAAAGRGAPIVNMLAARPVLSSIARGAGAGGAINALTSAASDAPLGEQIQSGVTAGALLGPVGYGVGKAANKLLGAGVDRETASLATTARDKFGIPIRADQISANPMVRFAGSVMQRLPFTGLGEHVAEQQTAFNRAVANEFGETADKITRPVIQRAKDRIGDVFDDVAARTGRIAIDHPFVADMVRIVQDARSVLGKDAAPIEAQVRRISDRINYGTNSLDAESYQSLTRKDTPLDRAMKSADPNVRHYAGQLREALDDAMQRSAPSEAVADLKEARYQWAVMKAVEPLAKKAPTGDISPALVLGKSKGGNLEELGQIGQRFLKEPPSSGTAERLAVMKLGAGLAAGAAGVGGAAYFDPEHFQRHAAELGAALLGAKLGGAALKSNVLSNLLLRGSQRAPSGRNALRLTVGPLAGALMNRPSGATAP
jgi:Cell Wall Hydrolase